MMVIKCFVYFFVFFEVMEVGVVVLFNCLYECSDLEFGLIYLVRKGMVWIMVMINNGLLNGV